MSGRNDVKPTEPSETAEVRSPCAASAEVVAARCYVGRAVRQSIAPGPNSFGRQGPPLGPFLISTVRTRRVTVGAANGSSRCEPLAQRHVGATQSPPV
jgi:hypothetical protein